MQLPGGGRPAQRLAQTGCAIAATASVSRYPKFPGAPIRQFCPRKPACSPFPTNRLASNVVLPAVSCGLQIITGGTLQIAEPNPAKAVAAIVSGMSRTHNRRQRIFGSAGVHRHFNKTRSGVGSRCRTGGCAIEADGANLIASSFNAVTVTAVPLALPSLANRVSLATRPTAAADARAHGACRAIQLARRSKSRLVGGVLQFGVHRRQPGIIKG